MCEPYEFFPIQTDPLNGAPYYLTEIARRFALTTNSVSATASSDQRPIGGADLQARYHQPGWSGRHYDPARDRSRMVSTRRWTIPMPLRIWIALNGRI